MNGQYPLLALSRHFSRACQCPLLGISLAFLAPDLVKAAIDGRLPYRMGVARLTDLPPEWSRQAFRRTDPVFEPSLYQGQPPPSGNAIFQGRDKDPKKVPAIQLADCRDKMCA
jgi:hypothetical protein